MRVQAYMLSLGVVIMLWSSAAGSEVSFVGQRPADAGKLTKAITRWDRLTPGTAQDSIQAWLHHNGYLDAVISSDNGHWQIVSHSRALLCAVTVAGDSSLPWSGDAPFVESNLRSVVDQILSGYHRRGYYYARASVNQIHRSGACIRVDLAVSEGPLLTVGRLVPEGLARTQTAGLRRYLSIEKGDILTDELLERVALEAHAVPFLDFLPPPEVRPRPGFSQADVGLSFHEQNLLTVFGGGGVIPAENNAVVWNLDLTVNNFFGRGRKASLFTERRASGRQSLRLKYAQPSFLMGVGEASVQVSTRDFREEFYEFELLGNYASRFGGRLISSLGLSWKRVDFAVSSVGYSAYGVEFSISRAQIDRQLYPVVGSRLEVGIGYRHRRYSTLDSLVRPEGNVFNETRSRIKLELMQPLPGPLGSRIQLEYVGLESAESQPPVAELTLIGGPGSLRGYRNDRFIAQRVGTVTLEPRLVGHGAILFLFYDAAYFSRREPSGLFAKTFRWSVGFGMSIFDQRRGLTLSLGWPDEAKLDQARLSLEFHSGV